jgi:hypothetical protein
MPSIGQTWVLASIGAVVEMGILSTLKRLLVESRAHTEEAPDKPWGGTWGWLGHKLRGPQQAIPARTHTKVVNTKSVYWMRLKTVVPCARASKRSHTGGGQYSPQWTPYLWQKSTRLTTLCNDMTWQPKENNALAGRNVTVLQVGGPVIRLAVTETRSKISQWMSQLHMHSKYVLLCHKKMNAGPRSSYWFPVVGIE